MGSLTKVGAKPIRHHSVPFHPKWSHSEFCKVQKKLFWYRTCSDRLGLNARKAQAQIGRRSHLWHPFGRFLLHFGTMLVAADQFGHHPTASNAWAATSMVRKVAFHPFEQVISSPTHSISFNNLSWVGGKGGSLKIERMNRKGNSAAKKSPKPS